jgi:tRNA(adenine34) deaminase
MEDHYRFMQKAFIQAERAFEEGEVPVGAVVVYQGKVIGTGYNQVEKLKDPTAHAEMIALSAANQYLNEKYLNDCVLYVTLEPCMMCAGALVWAKIKRIVFGAMEPKSGACGSVFNFNANTSLNHHFEIISGIMETESEWLLKRFFESKRANRSL